MQFFPGVVPPSKVYETLKRSAKQAKGGTKLSPVEAAVLGSGATLVAQALTTPLDVVRTRVMSASSNDQPYEGDGFRMGGFDWMMIYQI